MAHKTIREADGKRMLARLFKDYSDGKYEFSDKIVTVGPNTNMANLPIQHKWLTTEKLVVKPDQLIKRRGKNKLILVDATFEKPTASVCLHVCSKTILTESTRSQIKLSALHQTPT